MLSHSCSSREIIYVWLACSYRALLIKFSYFMAATDFWRLAAVRGISYGVFYRVRPICRVLVSYKVQWTCIVDYKRKLQASININWHLFCVSGYSNLILTVSFQCNEFHSSTKFSWVASFSGSPDLAVSPTFIGCDSVVLNWFVGSVEVQCIQRLNIRLNQLAPSVTIACLLQTVTTQYLRQEALS